MSKLVKINNKRGYFKLKLLNDFIENRLFVSVDYDELICEKFCKEIEGAYFLKDSTNRAILLSFMSDRGLCSLNNCKDDERFLKGFLPNELWNNIKQTYQQFVYTPTTLYYWLLNCKHCERLGQNMKSQIQTHNFKDMKKLSLSERQTVWLNYIITM